MLVTLPFALLLLDVWPLKRFWIESRAPIQNPKLVSLFPREAAAVGDVGGVECGHRSKSQTYLVRRGRAC